MAHALCRSDVGRVFTAGGRDPGQWVPSGERATQQKTPLTAGRRHRIRSRSPPTRRACGQLGSLSTGCRGDPWTATAAHKPQGPDPRAPRRDDREPAVRALPAPPGGLGSAMGVAHRRVRLGSQGSLLRRAERLGQDRARHPPTHRRYQASFKKTWPNGALVSCKPGTQPASTTSSSPATSLAPSGQILAVPIAAVPAPRRRHRLRDWLSARRD